MKKENLYLVKGRFEGKEIDAETMAYSKKQAKLKAGFNYGFGGEKISKFVKSSKIRVTKI